MMTIDEAWAFLGEARAAGHGGEPVWVFVKVGEHTSVRFPLAAPCDPGGPTGAAFAVAQEAPLAGEEAPSEPDRPPGEVKNAVLVEVRQGVDEVVAVPPGVTVVVRDFDVYPEEAKALPRDEDGDPFAESVYGE